KYAFVGDEPVALEGDALEAAFGRFAAKNTAVVVEPHKIVTWDHTKLGGGY
nr:pyridoxamine 5'-phosphate oxidase [Actinomycetota bacterium]NIS32018.1 pyridoxamine 5'-phosphate oxidase [Actinomycetota bacterium]NIU19693.1 pyridoxamine 5'-phosphate oxidase [Actinomycetota bacterium]NIU67090.1 pyridoxamine 5'-phosphate oxidase [Actinomycetota bacterium]NIV56181.1 pyridoxamine 5'-phosphate oxidase [Actinomycetota bacterium]